MQNVITFYEVQIRHRCLRNYEFYQTYNHLTPKGLDTAGVVSKLHNPSYHKMLIMASQMFLGFVLHRNLVLATFIVSNIYRVNTLLNLVYE